MVGIQLTDMGKIRFTGHVIGPECAKHGEIFPCRHQTLQEGARSETHYSENQLHLMEVHKSA
jgi:hypothetical protein